jgi:hypothetical protein
MQFNEALLSTQSASVQLMVYRNLIKFESKEVSSRPVRKLIPVTENRDKKESGFTQLS